MAVPGSYSWPNLVAQFGPCPADYQTDFYLTSVSASTNQRTLVKTWGDDYEQGCIDPAALLRILTNNS